MRIYIFLFALLTFTACSVSKEVSTNTSETETVKTITADVPEVRGRINLPLVPDKEIPKQIVDTLAKISPTFETDQDILTTQKNGQTTKSRIKVKSTFKKDVDGKPYLDTQIESKQDPVKAEEKTTQKSKEKNELTKIEAENPLKTPIQILCIIVGLAVLIYLFGPMIQSRLKK